MTKEAVVNSILKICSNRRDYVSKKIMNENLEELKSEINRIVDKLLDSNTEEIEYEGLRKESIENFRNTFFVKCSYDRYAEANTRLIIGVTALKNVNINNLKMEVSKTNKKIDKATPLEKVIIDHKIYHCLLRNEKRTLGDILDMSYEDFNTISGLGEVAIKEIYAIRDACGYEDNTINTIESYNSILKSLLTKYNDLQKEKKNVLLKEHELQKEIDKIESIILKERGSKSNGIQ